MRIRACLQAYRMLGRMNTPSGAGFQVPLGKIMSVKVGYSNPLLHMAEIESSIRFYELLGFTTVDTDRGKPLGWARLHCEGGAVMFLRAEAGI